MKKIAIIGAGISGVMAGYQCKRNGHDVTLFDKSRGVSGRSTTKRWDNEGKLGIDIGVPYITESEFESLSDGIKSFILTENLLKSWNISVHHKNDIESMKTYVGIPKMNSFCRQIATELNVIAQQKIVGITFDKTWTLVTDEDQFNGFDILLIAIPAPQVSEIHGMPMDVIHVAQGATYQAVNTLYLESKAPLWSEDYEEDKIDSNVIKTILADYLKPSRNPDRFTYVVHSSPLWATDTFDQLSKDGVQEIMINELCHRYKIDKHQLIDAKLHRWKYAYPQQTSNDSGFYKSNTLPLYACGDWCKGTTFVSAIESGSLLAHNIQ